MRRSAGTTANTAALLGLGLYVTACLAGCAAAGADTDALFTPVAGSTDGTSAARKSGYVMSADEQALDCKRLLGRMQIRILEIRDYNERNNTTGLSRSLQGGVTAIAGGTKSGTDPSGTYARDRGMLHAYNAQLAAKGCKTYDLDAELQPKDFRVTPAAVQPASAPK